MTRAFRTMLFAGAMLAPAIAQAETPLSVRTSFRLGDAGVLCSAQVRPTDARLSGIFDRAYQLTCRDAISISAPDRSTVAGRRSSLGTLVGTAASMMDASPSRTS